MSQDPELPPEPASDWRAGRRAARDARRDERRSQWGGAPIGAIVLILIGVLLLAQNFGLELPARWWALFLLIPATGALVAAVRHYRDSGDELTGEVIGSLISAAIFLVLTLAFFFGFAWGIFWPVLLIAIGLGILARDYLPRR